MSSFTCKPICAYIDDEGSNCSNNARFACKNCLLVQVSHDQNIWASPLMKTTWQPSWETESRVPAFVTNDDRLLERRKYLWGNVPALDILNLSRNEGEGYDKDLSLLFADFPLLSPSVTYLSYSIEIFMPNADEYLYCLLASGDMRNILKTVISLPATYKNSLSITVNDLDFQVVARNAIMLLLLLSVDEIEQADDSVIHIWYSSMLRKSDLDLLQTKVRPLIEEVYKKISDRSPQTFLAKTWTFGTRSLRLVFFKETWMALLQHLRVPVNLSRQRADEIRTNVTLAETRTDYRERDYVLSSPACRVSSERFRTVGLLLPFGHSRHGFEIPNPTIFQSGDTWPMQDSADPLDGWNRVDILATPSGPAKADVTGKLYYYLRGILASFRNRSQELDVTFRLFNLDAQALPLHLEEEKETFARIDTSNISDGGYLGVARTLALSLLLQTKADNPKATMVLLFMNAVCEIITPDDELQHNASSIPTLARYLPPLLSFQSPFDKGCLPYLAGVSLVRNNDVFFDRYMEKLNFEQCGQFWGMVMKEHHTIVDKWPAQMKRKSGELGAQEEFDTRLQSGDSGNTRYVEWKRSQ
ncbi:hypothetical protein G7046_g7521 [Stylonectria norvegica]|nr:hypothetical protein G7046_g7521 [Stylonectria norvegica]